MIQHTIELTATGYRLVIWEPAPTNTTRVSPFLFRATYLLSCPSKAPEILNMIKGEHQTIFSQARHKVIDEQTEQNPCKFPPDRVPVAF
jgi:hypothetical protein